MPWFCLPKLSFSSTALYSAVWAAYVFFILTIMKCPDSVVTVTDFLEQTQLPIDRNLPKKKLLRVNRSAPVCFSIWKAWLCLSGPSTIISGPTKGPGPSQQATAPGPSQPGLQLLKQAAPNVEQRHVLEGDVSLGSLFLSIALSSCCYTERSMSSIFLFLFSVIWNWNAILSERWLFSVGQY